MNFGEALEVLKAGGRVRRAGWNGKGMHLYLETFEGAVPALSPCLCMYTAQGALQPGWLASQADLLSEDWEVVGADDPALFAGESSGLYGFEPRSRLDALRRKTSIFAIAYPSECVEPGGEAPDDPDHAPPAV